MEHIFDRLSKNIAQMTTAKDKRTQYPSRRQLLGRFGAGLIGATALQSLQRTAQAQGQTCPIDACLAQATNRLTIRILKCSSVPIIAGIATAGVGTALLGVSGFAQCMSDAKNKYNADTALCYRAEGCVQFGLGTFDIPLITPVAPVTGECCAGSCCYPPNKCSGTACCRKSQPPCGGQCCDSTVSTCCPGGICANLKTDHDNCGACGYNCSHYFGYPTACCNGLCTDILNSTSNCGGCGDQCDAANGFNACSNGKCYNTNADAQNCGVVGHDCTADTYWTSAAICCNGVCCTPALGDTCMPQYGGPGPGKGMCFTGH